MIANSEMGDGGREVVYRMVEQIANGEMGERRRKVINWLIEGRA